MRERGPAVSFQLGEKNTDWPGTTFITSASLGGRTLKPGDEIKTNDLFFHVLCMLKYERPYDGFPPGSRSVVLYSSAKRGSCQERPLNGAVLPELLDGVERAASAKNRGKHRQLDRTKQRNVYQGFSDNKKQTGPTLLACGGAASMSKSEDMDGWVAVMTEKVQETKEWLQGEIDKAIGGVQTLVDNVEMEVKKVTEKGKPDKKREREKEKEIKDLVDQVVEGKFNKINNKVKTQQTKISSLTTKITKLTNKTAKTKLAKEINAAAKTAVQEVLKNEGKGVKASSQQSPVNFDVANIISEAFREMAEVQEENSAGSKKRKRQPGPAADALKQACLAAVRPQLNALLGAIRQLDGQQAEQQEQQEQQLQLWQSQLYQVQSQVQASPYMGGAMMMRPAMDFSAAAPRLQFMNPMSSLSVPRRHTQGNSNNRYHETTSTKIADAEELINSSRIG